MDTTLEFRDFAIEGNIAELAIGAAGARESQASTMLDDCLIGSAIGLIGTLLAACTGSAIGWFHGGALAAGACAFSCAAIYLVTYHALRGFPTQGLAHADTRWPRT